MAPLYRTGFDAHTHLDFPRFDPDRGQVCAAARAAGVSGWAIAGADPRHWARVERVAAETGGVAQLGIHPWWTDDLPASGDDLLAELATRPLPHGLGEIGLDHLYARDADARTRQRDLFRAQLQIARERDLPVALHCVRAFADLLAVVRQDGLPAAGGLVHAWSGSEVLAREALRLGLHLSFGAGVLRSPKVAASCALTPADRLLLETDCPDQPLVAGARGEPADLVAIAAAVAEIRGEPALDVLRRSGDAARRLLRVTATP